MTATFRSISAPATAASGNLTLTEPTNVSQGDLLVACIAYRDSAAFSLPAGGGWTLVATQQSSGNTSTTTNTSIGSGLMAYIIRGSSAPDLVFTRTGGDIAIGRIAAYPGIDQAAPFDVGSANTLGANSATVTTGTITTANANTLLVMACCYADNTSTSAQTAATDPTSGWVERADSNTATGADTGLCVSDVIKASAGATGTLQYTAGNSSRHVCIVGAFKSAASPFVSVTTGASDGTTTTVAATGRAHTAGNLLVVGLKYEGGAAVNETIADTALNTYLPLTRSSHAGGMHVRLFYAKNITGHATNIVTATLATARDFKRIAVLEYSGRDTSSPLGDDKSGNGTGTAMSTTNVTTTTDDEVIVAFAGELAAQTYIPGVNYAERWDFSQQSGGSVGGSAVEDRYADAGTYAVTMTQASSNDWAMAAGTFKSAAVGGGTLTIPLAMHHYRTMHGA